MKIDRFQVFKIKIDKFQVLIQDKFPVFFNVTTPRVFIALLLTVSVVWVPMINRLQSGQMYVYIQSVAAILAPPIAAVYLLALLNSRTNEKVGRDARTNQKVGMQRGPMRR